MGDFLDRNASGMMKYASSAQEVITEMDTILHKVERVLDAYAPDLDGPSQKQIEALHKCCDNYRKQMEVYQKIAKEVGDKGKRLADIRGENGG